jgi:UDP-3-O-[3-hydroxymyristoyl] N-acetylglucosamine deacetylase
LILQLRDGLILLGHAIDSSWFSLPALYRRLPCLGVHVSYSSRITPFPAHKASAMTTLPPIELEMQRTLFGSTQCTGVGVHSGAPVTLRLLPAPVDSGIVFIRTDIAEGKNRVAAHWDNVVDTRLCTMLGNEHGTVEHLMAAWRALDIDTAFIELDGTEVPIMDGSSAPFVLLIEMAGVQEQDAPRQWIEIIKPIHIEHEGKTASLVPSDQASFAIEIKFDNTVIAQQSYDIEISATAFKGEISRARTFGFLAEVEQLRKMGLARGGSLHNAVVISGDKVLNEDGLRYGDEFARHKLLDAIGDLSLAGAPIRGSFSGYCTGHALNNKLLHALFADRSAWRMVTRADPMALDMLSAAE